MGAALLENMGGGIFSEPQDMSVDAQVWGVLFDSIVDIIRILILMSTCAMILEKYLPQFLAL